MVQARAARALAERTAAEAERRAAAEVERRSQLERHMEQMEEAHRKSLRQAAGTLHAQHQTALQDINEAHEMQIKQLRAEAVHEIAAARVTLGGSIVAGDERNALAVPLRRASTTPASSKDACGDGRILRQASAGRLGSGASDPAAATIRL